MGASAGCMFWNVAVHRLDILIQPSQVVTNLHNQAFRKQTADIAGPQI